MSTTTVTPLDFRVLQLAIRTHFDQMKSKPLFRMNLDRDRLWELYLASFPEGTNPVYRARAEHDCSCCRSFVKNAGALVAIVDGRIQTLWDVQVGGAYQVVVDALAEYVRSHTIDNVFRHTEDQIGNLKTLETVKGDVISWHHFYISLPRSYVCGKHHVGPMLSEFRASHDVFLRALQEITPDAVAIVQDLIANNSLYLGAQKKNLVDTFARMKTEFDLLPNATAQDLYVWTQIVGNQPGVYRLRSDVIGTLLVDLSEGKELEDAVRSYEVKVAPTNYQRPSALVTPRMRDLARQTIIELGLLSALERRFALLEDVEARDMLFVDRSVRARLKGDVFDSIPVSGKQTPRFDRIEKMPIETFVTNVLPRAQSLEVLFDSKHVGNLVSLIAPVDPDAANLFKWDNPFSWSYTGDLADSILERVKSAGGNVTGELCCRLAWDNYDDLDFFMIEPAGTSPALGPRNARARNTISYLNKVSSSTGQLDVDMNAGMGRTRTPVENIFYPRICNMPLGEYVLGVHQFHRRESTNIGFRVQIDVLGTVHEFHYPKSLATRQQQEIATLKVTKTGVEVVPILSSQTAQREVWGLKTQTFYPVTVLMLSPNFWNEPGIGNKHYMFMLQGCENDGSARGFYNEFLRPDLTPHRKAMELVGAQMRTSTGGTQMSGLGFSSTKRASLVVRVLGEFQRQLELTF